MRHLFYIIGIAQFLLYKKQDLIVRAEFSAFGRNAHGRKKLYPFLPAVGERQRRFFIKRKDPIKDDLCKALNDCILSFDVYMAKLSGKLFGIMFLKV